MATDNKNENLKTNKKAAKNKNTEKSNTTVKKATSKTKTTTKTEKTTTSKSAPATKKTNTKAVNTTKKNNGTKKNAGTKVENKNTTTNANAKKTVEKKPTTANTSKKKSNKTVKKNETVKTKDNTVKDKTQSNIPKLKKETADTSKKKGVLESTTISTPEVVKELHVEEKVIEVDPSTAKPVEDLFDVRSILGAQLPTGTTKEDRKKRKKFYMRDAFVFATVIPILDLFAMLFIEPYKPLLLTNTEWINYAITVGADFVLIFILTYVLDFLFGEEDVKKINK